ncbi:hypothetical protein N5C96_29465 [Delftia tsuruhatensis]|jgi:hypothetical protein|nr:MULTISPECIES: hypothetical protein [Delftia]MDH0777549.1 hypothetical protein [Delftia tsuruhatensis]MDH1461885.1 hypothetical protein [Delftia tsuruhatensis]MDH1824602.1 hypothetical protein [Delftia tsuruhatensis]WGG09936.1 hypothetical protein N5O86_25330 [Delftia tsuruhatensis]
MEILRIQSLEAWAHRAVALRAMRRVVVAGRGRQVAISLSPRREMLKLMVVLLLMGLLEADQLIRQGLCSRDRAALALTDSVAAAEVGLAAVADR